MITNPDMEFAFIVRATGEATTQRLMSQLQKQISHNDSLSIIDEEECFEAKLRRGFELGLMKGKDFTVFIDADILLRSKAVNRIKTIVNKLDESDLGFGLRLWDRFYDRPKFRGLHIYRTSLLQNAITHVPKSGETLRPESYVKQKLEYQGYTWRNGISFYVAGIHDFFQRDRDIYYKFLVRSKRSKEDIEDLKTRFRSKLDRDYKVALQALIDAEHMTGIINNKFVYNGIDKNVGFKSITPKDRSSSVNMLIISKLYKNYGLKRLFWKSI